MGCCGKKGSGGRCCLCGERSNKFYPWGEKRKVCYRCKKKQELLIIEREKQSKRAKRLLAGIGE